jgi:peptide/nickel transport system substrate-binding protein
MNRRRPTPSPIFQISLLALLILPLAGCKRGDDQPIEPPLLAAKVEAGELPPLAERIPTTPLVIEPIESPGQYGGSLRLHDRERRAWSTNMLRLSGLFRFDQSGTQVLPDIAEGYEFSKDLKTLTLRLRPGHRWSDGEPFGADDILFWWEAYANNPAFERDPFWTFAEGEMSVEKVDDSTVRFVFPKPYPVVIDRWGRAFLSSAGPNGPMLAKHYMQQFHPDYNPEAEAKAEEEGFKTWQERFEDRMDPNSVTDSERPSLSMWIPESVGVDALTLVRNPYFHQVDDQGRQLPYIDRLSVTIQLDAEPFMASIEAGEADFEAYFVDTKDYGRLSVGAEAGRYRLLTATDLHSSMFTLNLNRTPPEPGLRELYAERDFRLALSVAIDREAMASAVFGGRAQPFPALPLPANSFFDPAWSSLNIQYDPKLAGELLDGLGLDKRDEEDFRLKNDGEKLQLRIEMLANEEVLEPLCNAVKADWQAVGVYAWCGATASASRFSEGHLANQLAMPVWSTGRTTRILRTDPRWFGFTDPQQQLWARSWTEWFTTDGAIGEEPPQEIKDLAALFDRWEAVEAGTPEYDELGREYFRYFAEEIPMIGTIGLAEHPIVVGPRLHGVPTEGLYWGSDTNFYSPYQPAQWWLDEGAEGEAGGKSDAAGDAATGAGAGTAAAGDTAVEPESTVAP